MSPRNRPLREDIPPDVDPCDVLYEVRLNDARLNERLDRFEHAFMDYRASINGDHAWLRLWRVRMSELGRVLLVIVPVVLGAVLTFHLLSR